jgi:hypothetical protein
MGKLYFNVVLLSTLAGTHQLLVYAEEDDKLGVSVQTINRNTEALVVASKQIGLEGNVDKIQYMGMSWDQNAGQNHYINIYKLFENLEKLRSLEEQTAVT